MSEQNNTGGVILEQTVIQCKWNNLEADKQSYGVLESDTGEQAITAPSNHGGVFTKALVVNDTPIREVNVTKIEFITSFD